MNQMAPHDTSLYQGWGLPQTETEEDKHVPYSNAALHNIIIHDKSPLPKLGSTTTQAKRREAHLMQQQRKHVLGHQCL